MAHKCSQLSKDIKKGSKKDIPRTESASDFLRLFYVVSFQFCHEFTLVKKVHPVACFDFIEVC